MALLLPLSLLLLSLVSCKAEFNGITNYYFLNRNSSQTFDLNANKDLQIPIGNNSNADKIEVLTQEALIFKTLDLVYRNRYLQAYFFSYDNPKDKQNSGDKNLISSYKCNNDLDYLVRRMDEMYDAKKSGKWPALTDELAAFFDSYGTRESGIYDGHYYYAGYYKACTDRGIVDLDKTRMPEVSFAGRFCVASLRASNWSSMIDRNAANLKLSSNELADYKRFFRIQIGLCMPDSCDTTMLETRFDDVQKLINFRLKSPITSFNMVDVYCEPDDGSELRKFDLAAWFFLVIISGWIIAIILATIIEYKLMIKDHKGELHSDEDGRVKVIQMNHLLLETIFCLSLRLNIKKLLEKPRLPQNKKPIRFETTQEITLNENQLNGASPNDLIVLKPFKVILLPIIIYCHVAFSQVILSRYSLKSNSYSLYIWQYLTGSNSLMECLFVISGFTITYKLFSTRSVARFKASDWAYSVFRRYWSLAPVCLLVFWFSKSMFKYTGWGPMWDYGVSNMTLRHLCEQESWFWPITLMTNYHSISEECLIPSWYISAEMQCFLLVPILLIAMHKSINLNAISTIIMIALSNTIKYHRHYNQQEAKSLDLIRMGYQVQVEPALWKASSMNLQFQYKVSAYVIGMVGGYFAYRFMDIKLKSTSSYQIESRPEIKLQKPKIVLISTVKLNIALIFILMYLSCEQLYRILVPDGKSLNGMFYSFWINSLSTATVLILFLTMTFQSKRITKILTNPIWTVANRLFYSTYIVQLEVLYWIVQYSEKVIEFENKDLIRLSNLITFFSVSVGIFLYILFELPLRNLEKKLIRPYFGRSHKNQ